MTAWGFHAQQAATLVTLSFSVYTIKRPSKLRVFIRLDLQGRRRTLTPRPKPKAMTSRGNCVVCYVYIYSWNAGLPFHPTCHPFHLPRQERPPLHPIKLAATITNQPLLLFCDTTRAHLFPSDIWFPASLTDWLTFHAFGSTKMYVHSATSFIDYF